MTGTGKDSIQIDKELNAKIIAKAWLEPDFKAALLSEPVATLRSMGVNIPEGGDFFVVEGELPEQHPHLTFVLPHLPQGLDLAADDVSAVAAIKCSGTWHNLCGSS